MQPVPGFSDLGWRRPVNQGDWFALPVMTEDERKLLEDTARNLLLLLRKWDDTIGGMSVAIAELYRAAATTRERKLVTIARLKLRIKLMKQRGESVLYLENLVAEMDKWAGFEPSEANEK
jgi:hypothetical protein